MASFIEIPPLTKEILQDVRTSVSGQKAGWLTGQNNASAVYWKQRHTLIQIYLIDNGCCKSDDTILYKEHIVHNKICHLNLFKFKYSPML